MISLESARALLNFGGQISDDAAEQQLRGAVAIHNLLERNGVAYLADEVGMGKTYVALGAASLFRHFNPRFRLLIIAPRENIQLKWIKEWRNLVRQHFKISDMRVKALHGALARPTVTCDNLFDLLEQSALDPDRDFFARLSSFSLATGKDEDSWKHKRNRLINCMPWLPEDAFRGGREAFKDVFAKALNHVLPVFDLVIVDEGHNLKHGLQSAAVRNRVLALLFGRVLRTDAPAVWPARACARRVLFLSATPLEDDYRQIWNQLDIFGFGHVAAELVDDNCSDERKRARLRQFLIRRVTTIPVANDRWTRNMYRREWRHGGVAEFDEALPIPNEMQKLVVALVQKKVAEVLSSERFNNSFQIGMLASFESFFQTTKVDHFAEDSDDDLLNFDDPDQTNDDVERLGADVPSVNQLATSYFRTFQQELPHPKMDSVTDVLWRSFETGQKALVFVRRIASVKELQLKLEERYNQRLFSLLRAELPAETQRVLERVIAKYQQLRRDHRLLKQPSRQAESLDPDLQKRTDEIDLSIDPSTEDTGGVETFFAWFFRGKGPPDILSGAQLQRRFATAGSVYSTFFEENHVAWLLGSRPETTFLELATYLGTSENELERELSQRAAVYLPRAQKPQRRNLFLAVQHASIDLLASSTGPLAEKAELVRQERYSEPALRYGAAVAEAPQWLGVPTFWTELRERPALCQQLWSHGGSSVTRESFRDRELRREMLSAMIRLGNPMVDLYIEAVQRLRNLEPRARELESGDHGLGLIQAFLNRLERQANEDLVFNAFYELREVAQNFQLILNVNEPELATNKLNEVGRPLGLLLREQQPVGGMFGEVNRTLIRQFRMPGYPLVLITTDLLQEGEDLHTFCSSVYHYGISWMPSSMEQRTGRIDRVGSQTERRLSNLAPAPRGEAKLQVYMPYLTETVELLQVKRVLDRMDTFLRLMHEDLRISDTRRSQLNVLAESTRMADIPKQYAEPLHSAFGVQESDLGGRTIRPAVDEHFLSEVLQRFNALRECRWPDIHVSWEDSAPERSLLGTMHIQARPQPFLLLLRSVAGFPVVRCVSPIGLIDAAKDRDQISKITRKLVGRVVLHQDTKNSSYNFTVENEVVLANQAHDALRVGELIRRVSAEADRCAAELVEEGQLFQDFTTDLQEDARND